jgi:hypothetical protein
VEHTIVWSATTCNVPGVGLYLGVAPDYQHMGVARGLSPRQARLFVGGRIRLGREGTTWPIYYYAVRDPSAVRVVPLDQPVLPGGFRHVELRIEIGRSGNGNGGAIVVAHRARERAGGSAPDQDALSSAAFLITIGLPVEQEHPFFEQMIDRHFDQEWTEIYERILMRCRPETSAGQGRRRVRGG